MRWEIWFLFMIVCSVVFAQSPILDQAIQVVRSWLGDPQAKVYFVRENKTMRIYSAR